MSECLFLLGSGHLPKRADKIARKHECVLVNHTDAGCKCGYGHSGIGRDECPACKRHWFAGPNLGAPFDGQMAAAVEADLRAAGVLKK